METSVLQRNKTLFHTITAFDFPIERAVTAIICLNWQSNRHFSREIGVSHTSINKFCAGKLAPGKTADRIKKHLGFDPWEVDL